MISICYRSIFISKLGLVLTLIVFFTFNIYADTRLEISKDQVNLALRRTADQLLREACDSTSKIPAIKQIDEFVWQVRIDNSFSYEELPKILEASLSIYEIKDKYQVAVLRCDDGNIVLGYHKFDYLFQNSIPCKGREREEECYFIEVTFLETPAEPIFKASSSIYAIIFIGGIFGFWYFRKQKNTSINEEEINNPDFLNFGNTKLDFAGQSLYIDGKRLSLTFREAKLLKLFAIHFEQLLGRDFIIQEVWADEGILVGRSVDVFVSRLRKKINDDPTIGIVSVHGVGYRLESVISS